LSDTNISVPAVETSQCSDDCREIVHTLARIGDKWTVMVVGALSNGPIRYNQIARLIEGISQRMLTLTLKGLEQDGMVVRTMYPTIPPRVDYELTDLGNSLIVPLRVLHRWAVEHRPAIQAAREEFAKREAQTGLRRTRITDPK
jgi:DNA-binding HxlR family transcriptional regulator